jgi:hypothetical protein
MGLFGDDTGALLDALQKQLGLTNQNQQYQQSMNQWGLDQSTQGAKDIFKTAKANEDLATTRAADALAGQDPGLLNLAGGNSAYKAFLQTQGNNNNLLAQLQQMIASGKSNFLSNSKNDANRAYQDTSKITGQIGDTKATESDGLSQLLAAITGGAGSIAKLGKLFV